MSVFLPTAPLVNVVPTGVIIDTAVVIIVCLLIVGIKHRKNSPGENEDYTVAVATAFCLLLLAIVVFSQLPL